MNKLLNVFTYDYRNWKLPRNWFFNISQFFKNFHWAYQRATKGYCNRDVWWLDGYYKELMHDALFYLADNHCGYPGIAPWKTSEEWGKYLKELATHLYKSSEEHRDEFFTNPYDDLLDLYIDGYEINDNKFSLKIKNKEKYEKCRNDYFEFEKQITHLQDVEFNIALSMLKEVNGRLAD